MVILEVSPGLGMMARAYNHSHWRQRHRIQCQESSKNHIRLGTDNSQHFISSNGEMCYICEKCFIPLNLDGGFTPLIFFNLWEMLYA